MLISWYNTGVADYKLAPRGCNHRGHDQPVKEVDMDIVAQPSCAYIYALSDPRTNEIRYIGKAENPQYRLTNHLADARRGQRTHKANWFRELLSLGLSPDLSYICVTHDDNWGAVEQEWIDRAKQLGWPLTNLAAGGRGGAAHKGRKMSEATLEKMRKASTGRKQSPESIAKTAAANRGRKRPPELMARINAKRRAKMTPETFAKIAAAQKGRKQTIETIEKRIAPLRGRKRKPEDMQGTAMATRALSVEDAKRILELSASGMFQRDIAKLLGVSQPTVWKIVNHKHKYAYEDAYA